MTYIPNIDGRQCVAAAHVELSFADFDANDNAVNIALPDGAQVIGGSVNVIEAFDASDGDTIAVGTTDNAARYLAAKSAATAGLNALVPTGYQHAAGDKGAAPAVVVTRTATGDPATAGKAIVTVQYVVTGKAEWTQD